jgi:hypothetical protein
MVQIDLEIPLSILIMGYLLRLSLTIVEIYKIFRLSAKLGLI